MLVQVYRQADTRPIELDDVEPAIEHLRLESERAMIRWRLLMEGPCVAFILGDEVIAIGGLTECNLGTADPWLVMTPPGRAQIRPLYRAIVAWIWEQVEAHTLHRLQAIVRYDDAKALVLLQHLGFVCEGTARQFGPDQADYFYYAWVKEG